MKTAFCIFLSVCFSASASTDSVARATYFHTKLVLPAPYGTGEVTAEAGYDRKNDIVFFRTLTVKIGSRIIKVPKRILDFYLGPRLTSIELLSGPPAAQNSKKPGYFNLTFKYESYSYESLFMPPARPMAQIIIRDGVITDLYRVGELADGYPTVAYDPVTLQKINWKKH